MPLGRSRRGIAVVPHGGVNTSYGQYVCYAMPNIPWEDCFVGSPLGVPLEEAVNVPGMSVPKKGHLIPSDAPGFSIEVKEDSIFGTECNL